MQEVVGRQAQEAGGIYIVVTDLHDCRAETNTIFKAIILQLKKKTCYPVTFSYTAVN